jgi:hypothetical protein
VRTWTVIVRKQADPSFGTRVISDRGESPNEVFERSLRKEEDLPRVDSGLPYRQYLAELYGEYEIVAAFDGAHEPVPTVTAPTEPALPDWSELAQVRRLVAYLKEHGVSAAEEISTGGSCFAVRIPLSRWDDLNLTIASGEEWSWQIYRDGEQSMAGTWSTASIPKAAKHAKRLAQSLGQIVG